MAVNMRWSAAVRLALNLLLFGIALWVLGGVLTEYPVFAYLITTAQRRVPIVVFGHRLRVPASRTALQQLGISAADWLLSSAALYVLVASVARVDYFVFLTRFFGAQTVALVLPTPGGIGVFEATLLVLRPIEASVPHVLAALLMYRVVYYLLPLFAAGGLLAARAAWQRIRV